MAVEAVLVALSSPQLRVRLYAGLATSLLTSPVRPLVSRRSTPTTSTPTSGDARHVAWWFEHADLGRLTVGRWESAGVLGTIDLNGHLFLPASASFQLLNGGFFIRGPGGQVYTTQWKWPRLATTGAP